MKLRVLCVKYGDQWFLRWDVLWKAKATLLDIGCMLCFLTGGEGVALFLTNSNLIRRTYLEQWPVWGKAVHRFQKVFRHKHLVFLWNITHISSFNIHTQKEIHTHTHTHTLTLKKQRNTIKMCKNFGFFFYRQPTPGSFQRNSARAFLL